ncbi:MAG: DUF6504 family protein [Chloroflexota bacterium]
MRATPRIINRPVTVITGPQGAPQQFTYRGRQRIKAIVDRWTEIGEWWDGEHERLVYRILSERGGMYELELRDGEWRLYKEYD